MSPAPKKARDNFLDAAEKYLKMQPRPPEPTEPPLIEPKLLHADPSSFHRGYNMILEAGGYMPPKIPCIVVPARPEDLRRYARKRTTKALMKELLLIP